MDFRELYVAELKAIGFSADDAAEIADWYCASASMPTFPAHCRRTALTPSGYDPTQPRNADGEWTAGGCSRPREHRDKGFQDRYGNGNPETLAANPKMNMERGKAVFTRLARKQTGYEPHAMYRKDIGWIGVEAGTAGNAANEYHGGSGIAHILAKHPGAEREIADVIQHGTVYHHSEEDAKHPNFRKLAIAHGNNIVIVSKFRDGRSIITSFDPGAKVNKETGETYIDVKERERYMKQITSKKPFGGRT